MHFCNSAIPVCLGSVILVGICFRIFYQMFSSSIELKCTVLQLGKSRCWGTHSFSVLQVAMLTLM